MNGYGNTHENHNNPNFSGNAHGDYYTPSRSVRRERYQDIEDKVLFAEAEAIAEGEAFMYKMRRDFPEQTDVNDQLPCKEAEQLELIPQEKKVWTKEEVLDKLLKDDKWLERGILAIFNKQTFEEQRADSTLENNGVGFNGADAHIMSYMANYLKQGNHLSGRFLIQARHKMAKYSGQLAKIANHKV